MMLAPAIAVLIPTGVAILGKNSAGRILADAARDARHRLATFMPLGVVALVAVYVAILRRGTLDLSKQMQMPATALR